jgi:hypothetical protein
MDEVDAIGGRRFSEGTSADREIQRTLMELLSHLDGFDAVGKVCTCHDMAVITYLMLYLYFTYTYSSIVHLYLLSLSWQSTAQHCYATLHSCKPSASRQSDLLPCPSHIQRQCQAFTHLAP